MCVKEGRCRRVALMRASTREGRGGAGGQQLVPHDSNESCYQGNEKAGEKGRPTKRKEKRRVYLFFGALAGFLVGANEAKGREEERWRLQKHRKVPLTSSLDFPFDLLL